MHKRLNFGAFVMKLFFLQLYNIQLFIQSLETFYKYSIKDTYSTQLLISAIFTDIQDAPFKGSHSYSRSTEGDQI